VGVTYNKGNWHWFYQADFFFPARLTPAPPCSTSDSITRRRAYRSFHLSLDKARWEASSKADYIANFKDGTTSYRSGNELTWEFTAMRAVTKKTSIGLNGYLYKQTTDDQLNGALVAGGNRGRDLAIGPQARFSSERIAPSRSSIIATPWLKTSRAAMPSGSS